VKKLFITRDLPVFAVYRYFRGLTRDWELDDDKTGIIGQLARLSVNTGIDEISVEEMYLKDAKGRKAARRFRVRISTWEGVCPKYGLLSKRELFALFDNVRYFTIACNRKALGLDINTGKKLP
jgi:hypothetical protein